MTTQPIAKTLIEQTDWSKYRGCGCASARQVGEALAQLLEADETNDVERAYWQLENTVFAQELVYQVAEPTVQVLVAALLDERPFATRVAILQLLYFILRGTPDEIEEQNDNCNLISKCKIIVSEGLWLVIKEFVVGPREAARDVLERLNSSIDFESLI